MKILVEVKEKAGRPIESAWVESAAVIRDVLERWGELTTLAGMAGVTESIRFHLTPIEQVKWRSSQVFSIRRVDPKSLKVRVKPGDNGTAWEYDLRPPAWMSADRLRLALVTVTEAEDVAGNAREPIILPDVTGFASGRPKSWNEVPLVSQTLEADGLTVEDGRLVDMQGKREAERLAPAVASGASGALDLMERMRAAMERAESYKRERERLEADVRGISEELRDAESRVREAQKRVDAVKQEKKNAEDALIGLMEKEESDLEVKQVAAFADFFRAFVK